jgi:hypothetical protein
VTLTSQVGEALAQQEAPPCLITAPNLNPTPQDSKEQWNLPLTKVTKFQGHTLVDLQEESPEWDLSTWGLTPFLPILPQHPLVPSPLPWS